MPELSTKVLIELLTEANTKGIEQAEEKMSSFGSSMVKASGVALAGFTAMAGAAAVFGADSLKEYEASEDATIRLQTGINNVKSAQDKSIQGLLDYDSELQKHTRFADEAIASGQAMLTTFQLNQGTIKQLTPGMLDMAEAFRKTTGETVDLNQISVLFGKVMGGASDGIDGMAGSLRKMGVIMTEEQKAVFKYGTEAERASTLSKIMDLNFKGFAEGGAKSFSGRMDIMNNQIGEIKEAVGKMIAEALGPLVDKISANVLPAFNNFSAMLEKNKDLLPIVGGVILALILPAVIALGVALWGMVAPLLPFYAAVLGIAAVVVLAKKAWETNFFGIRDIVNAVWNFIRDDVFAPLVLYFDVIKFALTVLWDVFVVAWAAIQFVLTAFSGWFTKTFGGQISTGFKFISDELTKLGKFWDNIWNGISKTVTGVASSVINTVKGMINSVIDFFNGLIKGANNLGGKVPGFQKIPEIGHLASGTDNWKGGLTWVGENGPELLNLPQGSQVTPNNKIGKAAGGINVTMNNTIMEQIDMDSVMRKLAWDLALT